MAHNNNEKKTKDVCKKEVEIKKIPSQEVFPPPSPENKNKKSNLVSYFASGLKTTTTTTKIVIIPHLKAKSIRNNSRKVELKKRIKNIGPSTTTKKYFN